MDQFSALQAFCRMVEAGGFFAAAAALGTSQAVIDFIAFASGACRRPAW